MIHCAEKLLKSIISSVKGYALAHPDDYSFYRDITELQNLSLQHVSLENDLRYFEEIKKLLSVIATIIAQPYIVNSQEKIIIRAEQAHGLTPEDFRETVLDSKLWKNKSGVMTPAEVHYYQNVDEIKNYENRFVVYLVDIISAQLAEYGKFYDFLVGTLARGLLTQDDSPLDKAYKELSSLLKKVIRIKATYFYSEVSKANTRFTHVEPTNVFVHNRAYNACYKFYLRNVIYGNEDARASDMAVYYFTRLLLALRMCGFELDDCTASCTDCKKDNILRTMKFTSKDFLITLNGAQEYGGILVTVQPKALKDCKAQNLIVFDGTFGFEEVQKNLGKYKNSAATAVDAVNLWDAAYVDKTVRPRNCGGMSENEIILKYLEDKTCLIKASERIYKKYCPACGGKNVMAISENTYSCLACGTNYVFIDQNIWFKKLRKT